ncbi:MAG: PLP-dependent aminotransferase family protein, partial [Clostridiales bacterium]|nr:PLP-dependent aminotransferase family protein [Clostridiales bacterium]
QRTSYLTTFSRSISPSFRLSVLVLPPDLAHLYHSRYSEYSSTVSRYEQHTLLQFIDQSHLDRHLNRVRKLYRAKKEHLSRELRRIPCAKLEILGANAGLHLLVRFPGTPETQLTRAAARAGIRLHGLKEFYMQDAESAPDGTLVLGYGALEMADITQACRLLRDAWSPILHRES